MTPRDPAGAAWARALSEARRDAVALGGVPGDALPADAAAAWALQAEVLAPFGPPAAWKVGGVTPAQRAAMGIARAIGAAIPRAFVQQSDDGLPPTVNLARFIAPLVECEYAYRLARDLPPRAAPWTRAEVAAAIAAVHASVEIVDKRIPSGSGTLAEMVDGFNNGALLVGPVLTRDLARDLRPIAITLERLETDAAGEAAHEMARGDALAVNDGDPLGTVVQLADAQPPGGPHLRAGDVVTTGSCTGAPPLVRPGRYRVRYGELASFAFDVVGA